MTSGFQRNLKSKDETRRKNQIAEFLDEIQTMIDREFLMASEQIMKGFESSKADLIMELSDVLNQVYHDYSIMQREEKVGELRWIYFSFLRSSMIEGYPAYRIDFYDERDCYAGDECCGVWEFTYIFSHFDKIKDKVLETFDGQSKAKAYEADHLLYALYERFHKIASDFFPALLSQRRIADLDSHNETLIDIKEGELFDRTIAVGQWRNETLITGGGLLKSDSLTG